jgi:hypothetical protein
MPEVVELRLTIPWELGPEAALLAELRDRVRMVEAEQEARTTALRRSGGRPAHRTHAVVARSAREPRTATKPPAARGAAEQVGTHQGAAA